MARFKLHDSSTPFAQETASVGYLQIEIREITADVQSDENPTDKQHFMFKVFRVVKKSTPVEAQDPDVRIAQALLTRSRNPGPQEELWIANSIAQFKAQGKLGTEHERLTQGVKQFREAAGNVGHVAHVVAQLNKLKLRLNDGVRSLSELNVDQFN